MVPEQESNAQAGSEETTQPPRVFKPRPRRAGRGRRGRGGRRPAVQAEPAAPLPADTSKPEVSEQEQSATSYATITRSKEPHRLQETEVASSTGKIQQAIVEVNQIIENLQETLDEMEEVLETLELAERQKDADEREIEALRRALRNLQRPRDEQRRAD